MELEKSPGKIKKKTKAKNLIFNFPLFFCVFVFVLAIEKSHYRSKLIIKNNSLSSQRDQENLHPIPSNSHPLLFTQMAVI